jgi:hypothetical protein
MMRPNYALQRTAAGRRGCNLGDSRPPSLSFFRWAVRMKVLVTVLVFLTWASAQGTELDYFSGRKWIEQQCATNTTPQGERLFVGRMHSPRYADIVQFRKAITIREIIDRTPLKGKTVQVCVMWPHTIPKSGSSFTRHKFITVGPSETPNYELKSLDVIWLYDDGPIIVR